MIAYFFERIRQSVLDNEFIENNRKEKDSQSSKTLKEFQY